MDSFILNLALGLPGFLLAIVFHEAAHAFVAYLYGDDTAKREGRLSLNPIVHIDPIGTVVFPMIGALLGGYMFGWAKPVPVNPNRFRNTRHGIFWVSFAGPGANIILGIFSAILLALIATLVPSDFYLYTSFLMILKQSVFINFILAAFNLIPFPPLDGSKMVSSFLDHSTLRKYEAISNYSFVFFLLLLFTGAIGIFLKPALLFGQYLIELFINLAAMAFM